MGKFFNLSVGLSATLMLLSSVPALQAQALRHEAESPATSRLPVATQLEPKGMNTRPAMPRSSFGTSPQLLSGLRNRQWRPAAPLKISGTESKVYGCLIFSDDLFTYDLGIYAFGLNGTKDMTLVEPNIRCNGGGTYANGKYYYCEWVTTDQLNAYTFIFDADTWEVLHVGDGDATIIAHDMDYDPISNKIYGSFIGEDGQEWAELDMESYQRTTIAPLEKEINAVAFNAAGQAYAVGYDGNLYKLDKTDGSMTLVGSTGLNPYYPSSATFDKATGRMYYTLSAEYVSGLYEINPANGNATLIANFDLNEEVCGLYFPTAAVAPVAPAMPEGAALDFVAGELTGKLRFTAPSKSFGGGNLSGTLNYTVTMDGTRIAIGSAAPGESVAVDVTVPASGSYNFIINTSNVGGNGQPAYLNGYIGYAKPQAPSAVSLIYGDNTFTLDWQPVTAAATEGKFNAGDITYTVTRYPGAVTAAEGLKTCSFSEPAEIGASGSQYYYTVEAVNGDCKSVASESNKLALQILAPPYAEEFYDSSSLDTWTIIGLGGAPSSWAWAGDVGSFGEIRLKGVAAYPKDDWAFTPGLRLEAGNIYSFSANAWIWNKKFGDEFIEVAVATEPSEEGVVATIVPKTQITVEKGPNATTTDTQKLTGEFQCPTTGIYYFGIHADCPKDGWYLCVDNVSVGAGQVAAAPAAVSDLQVVPDPAGGMSAGISFTAPLLSVRGDELTEITSMTVSRDGEVIKTFASPAPGAELSCSDSGMTSGLHTYKVTGHNGNGAGNDAEVTVFIGVNIPSAPSEVNIAETANPGEVTLSWPAVTVDKDGRTLNTSEVTYMVVDNGTVIKSGVTGTSCTFQAIAADGNQQFVSYSVYASTSAGRSVKATGSGSIPVGIPYDLPYNDSFALGGYTHIYNVTPANPELSWRIWSVEEMKLETPDGDDYMLAARGSNVDQSSMWSTGKIKLDENSTCALSFYYFGMTECENYFDVMINDGSGWTAVERYVAGSPQAWRKATVHLSQYKGKSVQIGFRGTVVTHTMIILDGISVEQLNPVDLSAAAIRMLARFNANTPVEVEVDVVNNGAETASGYTVELYRDNVKVAETAGTDIASGSTATVTVMETAPVTAGPTAVYKAVVVCGNDADLADNTTDEIKARIVLPNYPVPVSLEASESGQSVVLEWTAPDIASQLPEPVTDDFESYEAFGVNEAGDWNFIDADGSRTYGFNGVDFPHAGEPMAYIVFNNEGPQFDSFFNAVSGHQFMASFVTYGGENDDWMISPRLFGNRQTISFFAKTYNDYYGLESFEILYSTKTRAKADFVSLESVPGVPAEWTEYSFTLPAGARYVAVRCTSKDKMMFMVDDFTYVPYGAEVEPLTFKGYNVYRDAVRLNGELVAGPSFTDMEPQSRGHQYCVTAVYDRGESAPSNIASLSSLISGVASEGACVTVESRNIIVEGAAGHSVYIYGIDGRCIFSVSKAGDRLSVPVLPGAYIVNVDRRPVKVVVK